MKKLVGCGLKEAGLGRIEFIFSGVIVAGFSVVLLSFQGCGAGCNVLNGLLSGLKVDGPVGLFGSKPGIWLRKALVETAVLADSWARLLAADALAVDTEAAVRAVVASAALEAAWEK